MAKRNKKNKQLQRPVAVQERNGAPNGTALSSADEVKQIEDKLLESATEEDLTAVATMPDPAPEESKGGILARLKEALKLNETIQKRLERAIGDAEKEKDKAREEREEVKPQREKLEHERAALVEDQNRLEAKLRGMNEREIAVSGREADADSGFIQRHIQKLDELKEAQEELQKTYGLRIGELEEQRQKLALEDQNRRKEWEADFETKEKELRTQERDLRRDREMVEEERATLAKRIEQGIAAERETFEFEKGRLESALTSARKNRDNILQDLQKLEEVFRCFQPKSPEDVLAELEELKEQKRKLQVELDNRLSGGSQTRLEALERNKETSDAEKGDLHREISRLKNQLSKLSIAATELETSRCQIDALGANIALLEATAIEKTRETRELVEGKKSEIAFPSLTAMDTDPDCFEYGQTKAVTDLRKFAGFVRTQMAQGKDPRYYDEPAVRSFIGGMAMSRLHLLHGISGTGKTSLPLAFAKAVGAGVELIEVQAGWRDRDDLFGYYNSFEKKYYESKFLQALYKARCPAFRDRPFLIILDEMNLSHPEQYFADVLSALENSKSKRLSLMTSGVQLCPEGLVENGKSIDLPDNVWFVGTANQDETTKDFADKSYDRAHVMELTGVIERFNPGASQRRTIEFQSLLALFDRAGVEHKTEAEAAWTFLNTNELKEPLQRHFEIGWGPRLERQLMNYLPVVMACGGSKGEALDHIIASKILRKLRNRYNNRLEHLEKLKNSFESSWAKFDADSLPVISLELLEGAAHKAGGDV